jgi:hypothetical protein
MTCPSFGKAKAGQRRGYELYQCYECGYEWASPKAPDEVGKDSLALETASEYLSQRYHISDRRMRDHVLGGQVVNVTKISFDKSSGRYFVEVNSLEGKIGLLTSEPKEYIIGRARSGFSAELASVSTSSRIHYGVARWDRRCGSGLLPILYCSLWADASGTPVELRTDAD